MRQLNLNAVSMLNNPKNTVDPILLSIRAPSTPVRSPLHMEFCSLIFVHDEGRRGRT